MECFPFAEKSENSKQPKASENSERHIFFLCDFFLVLRELLSQLLVGKYDFDYRYDDYNGIKLIHRVFNVCLDA